MKRGLVLFSVSLILILSIGVISASWFTDFFDNLFEKADATGNVIEDICTGTATSCEQVIAPYLGTQYAPLDTICNAQLGCFWNPGGRICTGTANACSTLTTQTSCQTQSGCSWSTSTTPTCPEGYTCLYSDASMVSGDGYIIELMSVTGNSAVIRVKNNFNMEDNVAEMNEGETEEISGLVIYLKDTYEANDFFSVTLQFSLPTTPTPSCTDSDGFDIYTKGKVYGTSLSGNYVNNSDFCSDGSEVDIGSCTNEDFNCQVYEFGCVLDDETGNYYPEAENDYCPNGCVDGACVKVNYAGTCSALVKEIANPSDFEKDGVAYRLYWSNSYNSSWMSKSGNEAYPFTEYYSAWDLEYNDGEQGMSGWLEKSIMTFEDESFDTSTIMGDMIAYNFCQIHSYDGERVYVCNWNAYNKGVDIDQNDWKHREILWNNENVLVRFSLGFGVHLSEEEINKIVEKQTIDFLNSLKDNQAKYIGWESFNLGWQFSELMFDSLKSCPSQVPQDACSPDWMCITEPTICPEHGYQTQTCKDYSCNNEERVEQVSCNPGICSGCLVPKWFSPYYTSIGENRCIPYGFRFESTVGWHEGEQTGGEVEKLTIGESRDDIANLSISPTGVATLFVEGWGGNQSYTFSEGDKVEVDITGWDNKFTSLSFVATEVVYDTENYENSYVLFEFTYTYLGKVVDTINAYCEIDGTVQPQKTKAGTGEWARCQNNYECDSNLCSSGSCVELGDIAGEASAFKTLVVKFFCRITNLLDNTDYAQCLADNGVA